MGAPALEELRAQTALFSANGRSVVYRRAYKEIWNRL
jgi:hypothetical protein